MRQERDKLKGINKAKFAVCLQLSLFMPCKTLAQALGRRSLRETAGA